MTVRKRTASSTAHLLGTDLSDDGPIHSSPVAKRSKHDKKSIKVGDGWLWRPSRPKIPSPNPSPVPLNWEKPSPPRPIVKVKTQSPTPMEPEYEEESSPDDPSSASNSGSYTDYSDQEHSQEDNTSMSAGHTPGPGKGSVKDLKTVTKRLKSLDDQLTAYPENLKNELVTLKKTIHALEERTQRNEIRAAIRHDIIFDALKKISEDVNQIRSSSKRMAAEMTDDEEELPGSVEKSNSKKKIKKSQKSTIEMLLSRFTEQMNEAATVEEVKETGVLCKKYADDLIKTYI